MSIANYFNKLPKDAPLPIPWKPSAEPPTKWTKRAPGRPRKSVQLCTMFLPQAPLLQIGRILFLVLVPLSLFLLLEASMFFDTRGIRGWPQTLKRNVGLLLQLPLLSLTTNDVSAILQMCLSFIHQWWRVTMTVQFWSQLIRVMQQ